MEALSWAVGQVALLLGSGDVFGVCLSMLVLTLYVLGLVWEGNRNHITAVSSMCIVLGVGCTCS